MFQWENGISGLAVYWDISGWENGNIEQNNELRQEKDGISDYSSSTDVLTRECN